MKIFLFFVVMLTVEVAKADTWKYPSEVYTEKHTFGSVEIISELDATENDRYPNTKVSLFKDGKHLAEWKGIYFESIYANTNNDYFVGFSNSGVQRVALVIFDDSGTLHSVFYHDFFMPKYCEKSSILIRKWTSDDPEVEFIYSKENEHLKDITFLNCKGERTSLFEVIRDGHKKPSPVEEPEWLINKSERAEKLGLMGLERE